MAALEKSKSESDTCCLKSCAKKISSDVDSRVDVRAFNAGTIERRNMLAKWDDEGLAMFHIDCWKQLIAACKESGISKIEVNMVEEARKHAEFHNSYDILKQKAAKVAAMLKKCKYPIVFTGAGISTAAGIGDFRGIHGKWTTREKVKSYGAEGGETKKPRNQIWKVDLRPTYSHEAVCKLMEMGYIKYLISQNTDGLHRLSGIALDKMSELHGNTFVEKCEKCDKRYDTDPKTKTQKHKNLVPPKKCKRCKINHRTGNICPDQKCKGYLMNTIINFGDYLEEHVLDKATSNAEEADMVLALGTTLQVSPANSLVEMGQEPTRLVLCNRQVTPYDEVCYEKNKSGEQVGERIFGDCDDFMKEVMLQLLSEKEYEDWMKGHDERMKRYNAMRS